MEREQKITIQKYDADEPVGKPYKFFGTLKALKGKMILLQRDALPEGKKRRMITSENRTKHKKLGLGIDLWVSDEILHISHNAFWPVKLIKPVHIK